MKTFAALSSVRLGFDPDPILVVEADARRSAVAPEDRTILFERVRQAILATPGVKSAALENVTPMSNSEWSTLIENPPGLSLSEKDREVYMNAVSPDWFATYGTPILAGRDFTVKDDRSAPRVVIVNETFAKKYFGGASPVGRFVRNEPRPGQEDPRLEIVGVARDAVYDALREAIPPTLYEPSLQQKKPEPSVDIAVHAASGSPALLSRGVAEAIGRVDGDLTISFRPLRQTVRDFTVQERVVAMLSGFFGGLALLLAGIGLYGVMSYAVSRRRTEIGIRMALGAGPAGAVRLVLLRVALLVGLGVLSGAALSWWAARFLDAKLLFQMQPRDPWTMVIAALVLSTIGGLAGWLPARRASRIDPARVLREG
jgi:predicted permease